MTDTADMSQIIRATLEDFGVVKPPRLPKLEVLVNEVRRRSGTVALDYTDKGAKATVGLSGNRFDAIADTPAKAVAEAFCQALLSEPAQVSLFGGDGTLNDETRARLDELRKRREAEEAQGDEN